MYIGADLGGTTVKIGVVNRRYRIVDLKTIKTDMNLSARQFTDNIIKEINELKKKYNIESLGIGSAGDVHYKEGFIVKAKNLPFNNNPIGKWFEKGTGLITKIDNDANCAALGEFLRGDSKHEENIVILTLGTGIGGGIIINKKIFHGHNGRAGEIGHICIDINGKDCVCGGRGCFEHYASATALIKQTKKAVSDNPDSVLAGYAESGIDGKTVFDAFYEGKCPVAGKVLDKYLDYLAIGVTNVYNILEPDAIILGGGISRAGEKLLNPLKNKLDPRINVRISVLQSEAGIIGAALLPKYNR